MIGQRIGWLTGIVLAAALAGSTWAQTSTPSTEPGPLKIVVTAVEGQSQYRPSSDAKWQPPKIGEVLAEGVEFRTGPRGAIQFTVGTDQVYRVDRLSVVKVMRATLRPDGTIATDVGMEYGRVSKDVDVPQRPHEDTIVTPASTLAVRGTRVSLYDQPPFQPEAVSLTGQAVFSGLGQQTRAAAFGAKGQGTAVVTSSNPSAASNALNNRLVDPSTANARTPTEQTQLADLITNGQVVTFSNPLTLPVASNTGFPSDSQLPTLYSGDLVFYIRWNTNTHVQMQLVAAANGTNAGEFIFPALGLNRSPSGGQILFDNLGGPTGGYEVITYPNENFPDGEYAIGAVNAGNVATTVTFNAFIQSPTTKTLIPQQFDADPNDPLAGGTNQYVTSLAAHSQTGAVAVVTKKDPNSFYRLINPGGGLGGFATPAARTNNKFIATTSRH